jgi:hypothetical protein
VALPASPAHAATVSVPCSVPVLVEAINTANSAPGPDTLSLAPGCTYQLVSPDTANPANGLPAITSNITINGNGATIKRDSASAFRIVFVAGTGTLMLNKTTVSGGEATDCPGAPTTPPFPPAGLVCGAGILNHGTVTVNHSRVIDNTATSDVAAGGAGVATLGTATLNNTEVSGNTASYTGDQPGGLVSGGGITSVGVLTVNGSRVFNNTVALEKPTRSLAEAAGISSFGQATIKNTVIDGNRATAPGGTARGALVNPAGTTTVTDTIISNNTTAAEGGISVTGGGGSTNGTISLTRTLIIGNHATADGGTTVLGGGFNVGPDGAITLSGSTILGNTATGGNAGGGGLANALGGTLTIVQTHISNNTVSGPLGGTALGGGLFHAASGSTSLDRSAVTGNKAGNGGGIFKVPGSGMVKLINTVVKGNTPNNCAPLSSVPGCSG